jgi:hypothetical protein
VAKDDSAARALVMCLHLVNTFLLLGAYLFTGLFAAGMPAPDLRRRPAVTAGLGAAAGMLLLVGTTGAIAALGDTLFPSSTLLEGIAPELLVPPVNVLRLSMHPQGLAPRILNYADWRAHVLARIRRDIDLTADAGLAALLAELKHLAVPEHARLAAPVSHATPAMVVPLRLSSPAGVLSFISTITVFGTPVDVTLSEIAIESFFPADEHTAGVLRSLAG